MESVERLIDVAGGQAVIVTDSRQLLVDVVQSVLRPTGSVDHQRTVVHLSTLAV